ncbi:MAG: cytidylate kinase-like family protein [Desulfobacterales bacterium]|nr:cytidylate kinase-like family protein [Desulfobacterales bacterium]
MAIVTISRGSYSRGKEVAEKLAQELGYECISRDILLEASDEFNIPEIKLIRALHDAPSVLERFQNGKERYLSYLKSALLQHVKSDNVVYHGLAGHYFLRDIPHVLKVRVIADMADRVKEEMKRENISAEKALYILKKDDEERRKWGIQVYGMDTWDSRLYDMVLNVKTLTVDDAIRILSDTVRNPAFKTTPESQKRIDDMALAMKVQVALVQMVPSVKVEADAGHVFVSAFGENVPRSGDLMAKIKAIAAGVDGVGDVTLNVLETPGPQHRVNPFHNIA